ncbi:MAG TPA: hypothetical protein VMN58_07555 [Acidimicrobiales bacterium]|nr:hypothetical protein [Acidimicrobiales bacterium]
MEPNVLGDTFRHLLDAAGQDEVVYLDPRDLHALVGDFDAILTTEELPPGVRSPLVIRLPNTQGDAGEGVVIDLTGTVPIAVEGIDEIIDLLDERCVATERRATRLGRDEPPALTDDQSW